MLGNWMNSWERFACLFQAWKRQKPDTYAHIELHWVPSTQPSFPKAFSSSLTEIPSLGKIALMS
jgi:hypothetical protein